MNDPSHVNYFPQKYMLLAVYLNMKVEITLYGEEKALVDMKLKEFESERYEKEQDFLKEIVRKRMGKNIGD